MASDWKFCKIGDVAKIQGGYAFKSKDFSDTGTPVIKIKNVRKRDIDLTDVARVSQEVAEQASSFLVKSWDVLISMTGSGPNAPASIVGRVARHSGEDDVFLINQRVGRFLIKEKEQLDQRFLYYLFSEDKTQLELLSIATGSANQVNISGKQIESIEVNLPPLSEQKAIAHVLGSLDDKIELNRQMNETLEAMAQALFKSWFVDFDPVIDNVLAAGNAIPDELLERAEQRQATEKKDDSDIQSLFPDEFEFTDEMGWIPKGWEVKESGGLFDVRDGTHDSPKKSDEGKYLITSRHITSGVIDYPNAYLISQDDFDEVNKRSLVESYDILITMIGTVGVSMLVLQDEIDFAIKNVGLFKTSNNKSYAVFFYLYLNSNYMTQFLDSRLAGTTQKYLTLKVLRALPVVTPDNKTLSHFVNNMSPIFKKIHSNHEQIGILAKLRDTLLPKLMSGEIRISDAEALVDETL